MRITMLLAVALVLAVSVPAHAVDLYSSLLYSGTAGPTPSPNVVPMFECTAYNSGTGTTKIKVTIQIITINPAPETDALMQKCIDTLSAGEVLTCSKNALGNYAYCKVTTSSSGFTESNFTVLTDRFKTGAQSIPR
jgi:hypothetical protein